MADQDPSSQPQAAWEQEQLRDPHALPDKAQRVRQMFRQIADSYDRNNRLHSLWQDQVWRRRAVSLCHVKRSDVVLDVACGTGDLTLAFAAAQPARVIGLDFADRMLTIARQKAERSRDGLTVRRELLKPADTHPVGIHFAAGDAMRLPVPARSVDVVAIAFGIRNVADPAGAIREFHRVLRPGGRLCVLEFSLPTNPVLRSLYSFYFHQIMPRTATWISGDRSGAYRYLPQSVNTFLGRQELSDLMRRAGFLGVTQTPMTFGVAVAYLGRRR